MGENVVINHLLDVEVYCSDCGCAVEFTIKKFFEDIHITVEKCSECKWEDEQNGTNKNVNQPA